MSVIDPSNTTAGDIVSAALGEAGVLGRGQSALAEDITDGLARLQWMLQEWERQRWMVYCLVTLSVTSTGAQSYTVGPGGTLNTGASSVRPARVESAFLRQISNAAPNQIDYPLTLIFSREDYNRIALKSLQSFPGWLFYDSAWPLGSVYPWPVPQASIYALHVTVMAQLPPNFATTSTPFTIPYEYYSAMLYNLALRLRSRFRIPAPPGDPLPGLAKAALNVIRTGNSQIGQLHVPADLGRAGIYNIFSDRTY